MVTTVNVHEAKSTLSKLLERVAAGERIIIARAGTPVAELVRHERVDLVFGTARGLIELDSATFDEADDEIRSAFEGS